MTGRESGPILPGQARRPSTLRCRLLGALVLLMMVATCIVFRPTDGDAAPALPGDPCEVDPRITWSETEKWVWDRLCVGEIADLNEQFDPVGPPLERRSPEGWPRERKLSSAFLETILTHDPWRSAINRQGVRIVGGWFAEKLDLQEADITHRVWLEGSRFDADVDLSGAKFSSTLSLENSALGGVLNLSNANIGGNLHVNKCQFRGALEMKFVNVARNIYMNEGAEFNDVNLLSANIGNQLILRDAEVRGKLYINSANVGGTLFMDEKAVFADTNLIHAKIGQQLVLAGAKVTGTLDMTYVSVGGDLRMENAEFADIGLRSATIGGVVRLIDAKVAGSLDLNGATLDGALLRNGSFGTVDAVKVSMARNLELNGAKVTGALNMNAASVGGDLFMRDGAEFDDVNLLGARVDGQVDLSGANVAGTLNMDSADIGQSLYMRSKAEQRAEFRDVLLLGAKVGGQVSMIGAKVTSGLRMDSAGIGQDLLMRSDPEQRAEFDDVTLRGVKVGGTVSMIGAKVAGALNMDAAGIGQHLLMRSDPEQRAEFDDVILRGAKVGGQIDLIGAKVAGTLNMEKIDIGTFLLMRSDFEEPKLRTEFNQHINLIFATIGSGLTLKGAALSALDLTGSTIEGELALASRSWSPQWRDDARLVLRNAKVDAIGDTAEEGVWPRELDLDGFVYDRLGGAGSDPDVDVAARGSEWFVEWLARDQPYSPQPYEQLAKVLREMGHGEEANDVLFAGRERARKRAWEDGHYGSWLGLWLLQLTIGYGYGTAYFRSLYWVVGFVALGSAICIWSRYGPPSRWRTWHSAWRAGRRKPRFVLDTFVYSLDQLLPIIQLSKRHNDIHLRGGATYYFYFHKIMGYVLASFLIAGLAGLTK